MNARVLRGGVEYLLRVGFLPRGTDLEKERMRNPRLVVARALSQ